MSRSNGTAGALAGASLAGRGWHQPLCAGPVTLSHLRHARSHEPPNLDTLAWIVKGMAPIGTVEVRVGADVDTTFLKERVRLQPGVLLWVLLADPPWQPGSSSTNRVEWWTRSLWPGRTTMA